MNFKTKIAYTAVLATLGLAAGSAQAAYLSETGAGQALIYPYYTVQSGFDTYISVVNTSTQAKAVKVRFLESKATAEVLDFNLFLSVNDWWGGVITPVDRADATKGAKFVTTDKSCTAPYRANGINEPFRNVQYMGDLLGDDIARTREGYVEIIEMGPIINATIAAGVTHTTAGVPADCKPAVALNNATGDAALGAPTGGLIGTATLINGAQGTDYSYDPVVLDDMFKIGTFGAPGSVSPALRDAYRESVVIRRNPATNQREVLVSTWPDIEGNNTAIEAVSAVLAHSNLMNEYSIEKVISAGTDWVVTFPTKRAHHGERVGDKLTAPFTSTMTKDVGACEEVTLIAYDREEQTKGVDLDFSPMPAAQRTSLCWEANVITFTDSGATASNVLTSARALNLPVDYQAGWLNINFATQKMTNAATQVNYSGQNTTATYHGLPAVGFGVMRLVNGNVGGVLSNYGGLFAHKYKTNITMP